MEATELDGLAFSLSDWHSEWTLHRLARCPRCQHVFFYDAYQAEDGRRYRLCKFCGLYQEPQGPAVQAKPCAHGCERQHFFLDSPYIQWCPDGDSYRCLHCGETDVPVADTLVPSPYETADHPWHAVPRDPAELSAFFDQLRATG